MIHLMVAAAGDVVRDWITRSFDATPRYQRIKVYYAGTESSW